MSWRWPAGLSLAWLWAQFALTGRWAHVDGALHGPKRWPFAIALALATAALLWPRRAGESAATSAASRWLPAAVACAGLAFLVAGLTIWFPPATWTQVPYLDNWATRYLTTVDGVALLRGGAAAGWNWAFLGGYATATDITQNLTALGALPMTLLGPAVGFHVLHVALFLGIPALVYADLALAGERDLARLALGLTAVTVAGFSYLLLRSGDTNSLAGVLTCGSALVAAHAARLGRRWGPPLVVLATAFVAWTHTGFLIYTVLFLLVDAAVARSWRSALLAVVAGAVALVAALPLTWELWAWPSRFLPNNVIFETGVPTDWPGLLRKVYYNVELLWLPGRAFNDFTGLSVALIPVLAWVAWRHPSRARFYAIGALIVEALLRLNTPEFAYVFLRPVHLLSIFMPVALAAFLLRDVRTAWRVAPVAAMVFLYLQVWWHPVPHVATVEAAEPALAARLKSLPPGLILLENTFHRDMDAAPDRIAEAPPFAVHFESLLARSTGRRFYAGMWDGWQWCPERERVLCGGAFRGRSLAVTPHPDFTGELGRWGIGTVVVWSDASKAYLDAVPGFTRTWADGPWQEYRVEGADTREVVAATGSAELRDLSPLGGRVVLRDVRAGGRVVVRTSHHPAWTAASDGVPVPLSDVDGQLAFEAPRDGSYDVELRYPSRTWLIASAIGLVAAVAVLVAVRFRPAGH